MEGLTSIADYFIICSAATERQTNAIYDSIESRLREEEGVKPLYVEGAVPGRWILLDYGDFIVHIFTDEARGYYDLERLWREAKELLVPAEK